MGCDCSNCLSIGITANPGRGHNLFTLIFLILVDYCIYCIIA